MSEPPVQMPIHGDMEAPLESLYAERELLQKELGVSSAEQILWMVRSLEAQLVALYSPPGHGD